MLHVELQVLGGRRLLSLDRVFCDSSTVQLSLDRWLCLSAKLLRARVLSGNPLETQAA